MLGEFRIVYLTGPRQSGKTTLARAVAAHLEMDYLSLDDQAVLASIQSDPHGFIRSLHSKKVVLDEFQYAPELIPALKQASDHMAPGERGKFLLTGSTDFFRSARVQEALPGHMARLELLPLSLSELRGTNRNVIDAILSADYTEQKYEFVNKEALATSILNGGYPEVQDKSSRAKQIWYRSYMEGRLFKDFDSLYAARGDYHSKLQALTPYLAGLCGNLLKYASVGNDLELDDRVVKNYIEILELMFIVRRVPAWLRNRSKRQATQLPKLHFVDTGLACHLLGLRDANTLMQSQYFGGLLENLLFAELCKHSSWAQTQVELLHFRDHRQFEVDLVIERDDGKLIAVEIKASATIRQDDFKSMARLAEFAGNKFERGLVLYTGREILPFKLGDHTFEALPMGLVAG